MPEGVHPLAEAVSGVFVVAAFWSLPAATVIAVTRHGLFEIDRIVSRSAAYAVVAAVLVAFYAGSVLLLQAVLPAGSSSIQVAASTLATAALFRPLRRRVQQALDRRFNRARYEADRVAGGFARGLRQQQALDLETVNAELTDVVTRAATGQGPRVAEPITYLALAASSARPVTLDVGDNRFGPGGRRARGAADDVGGA